MISYKFDVQWATPKIVKKDDLVTSKKFKRENRDHEISSYLNKIKM